MSHIARHRKPGRAALVVVGLLAVLCIVTGVMIVRIILGTTATAGADNPVTAAARGSSVDRNGEVQVLPVPCKAARTISPAKGETLYPYLVSYLSCVEPGAVHRESRIAHLVNAFHVAFPDADPKKLPPAITVRILGPVGYESIDPRHSGLEAAP